MSLKSIELLSALSTYQQTLDEEEEETVEEEEEEEEETTESAPADGLQTPSGLAMPSGMASKHRISSSCARQRQPQFATKVATDNSTRCFRRIKRACVGLWVLNGCKTLAACQA